jgi:hypothetical protein
MGAALALLPVVLQAIPTVEVGVENLIAWVHGLRAEAQQSGEWTAAQDAAFLDALAARGGQRAWKGDAALRG